MGPTKVVATIGYRSSDEEGPAVRRRMKLNKMQKRVLTRRGTNATPAKRNLSAGALIRFRSVIWEDFNARGWVPPGIPRCPKSFFGTAVEETARRKRYTGRRHRLQSVATSARKILSCRYADLGGNTAPCMGLRLVFRCSEVQRGKAEVVQQHALVFWPMPVAVRTTSRQCRLCSPEEMQPLCRSGSGEETARFKAISVPGTG